MELRDKVARIINEKAFEIEVSDSDKSIEAGFVRSYRKSALEKADEIIILISEQQPQNA